MSTGPERSTGDAAADIDWFRLGDRISEPGPFFREFLDAARQVSGAETAALLVAIPDEDSRWRVVTSGTAREIDAKSAQALGENGSLDPVELSALSATAVRQPLPSPESGTEAVLALLYPRSSPNAEPVRRGQRLLPLLVALPTWFENRARLQSAESDLGQFASVLDLTVLLYSEDRFEAAAMLLCNEIASRFDCHRVSLGWIEGNDIRVRAVSHTDKIEKRMESVQQLAAAMEEATDQGVEILYPGETDRFAVDRDHKIYASEQKLTQVLTLPLLRSVSSSVDSADPDEAELRPTLGALTLERDRGAFSDQEIRALRLLSDQITPRLGQLREKDGWFGKRWLRGSRQLAARVVGVDHTWVKLLAIGLTILVAVLVFGQKEFRVKAPFAVETTSLVYLSAPFAGYLGETPYREGDAIEEEATVFALDTSELLLEKQQALAETTRHRTEAVRAEAVGEVSEMRIAKALLEQAEARLALVEHQLGNAEVVAPFAGVIVEGELTERVNSPVEQGEVLVKLAQLTGLYPELKIDESDIRFVETGATGQLAFAARPDLSFPIEVVRIEPAARSDETGNHFTVRCRFPDEPPEWWRPGMTGVAKIDCGERSLGWIFTRKTIDRIRLFLW